MQYPTEHVADLLTRIQTEQQVTIETIALTTKQVDPEQTGVSASTLYAIEHGHREHTRHRTVALLRDAYPLYRLRQTEAGWQVTRRAASAGQGASRAEQDLRRLLTAIEHDSLSAIQSLARKLMKQYDRA